jgi:hypothetical protein
MSPESDNDTIFLDAALWNLPRLRRTASEDVSHFINAFSRRLDPGSIPEPSSPLDIAAVGVAADIQGDTVRAREMYAALSAEPAQAGMLGMFLSAWSATSDGPETLTAPLRAIDTFDGQPLLQARLCCKLIAAAFAHRWDDALPDLLSRAQAWAPAGSMIAAMLMMEAYNLLGTRWPRDWGYEVDELTGYDWVRELAWSAAEKSLVGQLTERARSPWTITIGAGFSETDDVIAAYMQAEWAGAIWLRREISQQLAAHILLDDATRPRQAAVAVSLWALSSTNSITLDGVTELAEAHFDHNSAQEIITQVNRGEPLRHWSDGPLVDLALAMWDLLSVGTTIALMERLPLFVSDHPYAGKVASFWALASLRAPERWGDRFVRLDERQRRQLLQGLSVPVAERLPTEAALRLLRDNPRPEGGHDAHVVGVLADRVDRHGEVDLSVAPAVAIVLLGRDAPSLVKDGLLDRALGTLVAECREVADDSRRGSRGMGIYEPYAMLALGCTVRSGGPTPDALTVFVEAATDVRVSADVRFEAIRGLTAIAQKAGLPADVSARIKDTTEGGTGPIFEFVTPRLLHAARIGLIVATQNENFDAEILTLVRDDEPRVRQVAIEAAALALRNRQSEVLEGAIASALFDPDEATVRMAIGAADVAALRTSAVRLAIGERLMTLFEKGNRRLRAAVVTAVRRGLMPPDLDTQACRLLDRAREDRSFQVRTAASKEAESASAR